MQFLCYFKDNVLSCTNLKLISQCKKPIRSITFCTRLYIKLSIARMGQPSASVKIGIMNFYLSIRPEMRAF